MADSNPKPGRSRRRVVALLELMPMPNMTAPIKKILTAALAASVVTTLGASLPVLAAKAPIIDSGYTWGADVVSSDFRSDTLELRGNVRVVQGPSSIEAQTAKGLNYRAEKSR